MRSSPASELGRAGQIVAGKFRLDAVIGRGGMGSVWSATHVGLGHRLALKLIAREYVRSPEALRRFDAEAKAAARLQSRHVVQVFDNGTLDDGTPFIAMELLSGENVSARIEHMGPVGLGGTVEILSQCCKALGRAHAAGIVHRDIKPDNIFLAREPDGDAEVAKILDFGVAKMALEDLESESQVTGTGALLGTPLYMSPEQIRGARDADQRADLYSLGLVAYTMLTGRVAITGETFGDILVKICTQPLPSLVAAMPSLPYAMEAWFHKACAREPGDRFASAQGFINALRAAAGAPAHVSGMPLASAPTIEAALPAASRTPSFGESAAIASTLAAARGTTGPALPSALITGPGASPPAFSQSAAPMSVTAAGVPRRSMSGLALAAVLAGLLAVGGGVVFAVSLRHGDPAASTAPSAAPPPAAAPVTTATATATVSAALPALVPSVPPARAGDDAATQAAAHSATPPHATVPPTTAVSPPTLVTAAHGSTTPPTPPARAARPIDVGY